MYTSSFIETDAEASQRGFEIVHCEIWPTACSLKKRNELHFGGFTMQTSVFQGHSNWHS